MKSLIFSTSIKWINPLLWVVSAWLLFRGHNAPGGGFIAGLVASTSVIFKILDKGWTAASFKMKDKLITLLGAGLLLSVLSGALALLVENPFMTGRWLTVFGIEMGSPQLFDCGVFLVVYACVIICTGLVLKADEGNLS